MNIVDHVKAGKIIGWKKAIQLGRAATPDQFGLIGNTSTNDTTYMQAAVDTGLPVFLREGTTYTLNGTITPASGTKLFISGSAVPSFLLTFNMGLAVNNTDLLRYIDQAVSRGAICSMYGHGYVTSGGSGNDTLVSQLEAVCEKVADLRAKGQIKVITAMDLP